VAERSPLSAQLIKAGLKRIEIQSERGKRELEAALFLGAYVVVVIHRVGLAHCDPSCGPARLQAPAAILASFRFRTTVYARQQGPPFGLCDLRAKIG
jgi:hypothetical protein